ncbi:MAG: lipid A biosynthesis acyltransferase [Pseudomonadota bacterium]|jgi:KDO2-lipid IV(A) lauroyltransferase
MMLRAGLALFWLAHLLPVPVLAALGEAIGRLAWRLPTERRQVVRANLALCFPERSADARERLGREHFAAFARSALELGLAWWSRPSRLARVVRIEGEHWLDELAGRPLIVLTPHFVGLEIAAQRMASGRRAVAYYSHQKNRAFDAFLRGRRNRFGTVRMVSRQQGIRPVVRAIREGLPLYYLPDMDLGERDSIFVPFFGQPAATVPALGRLVRLTGATVLPCVTEQQPGGGYVVRLMPPLEGLGHDDVADTLRMNAFIEEQVRLRPAQYLWLHKRFKTRPPGASPVY